MEVAVFPGLSPRQTANQLLRCFRAEADLMRVLGGWTARVAENNERYAFARDIGYRAEHAQLLLHRLHRLRTTDQMIAVPDEPWRSLVELIDDAPSTAELVAAVYRVVGQRLIDCYRRLLADSDPLGDELTIRMVERELLPDHLERHRWAESFLLDHTPDATYVAAVEKAFEVAGGLVVRATDVPGENTGSGTAAGTGFWLLPRQAPATIGLGSEYRIALDGEQTSACPPASDFGPDAVQVLVNHHGLMPEIASLCIIGSLLHEVIDRPWEFYRDFATQCSDEVRHIGLLVRRLHELGADTDTHPFPTWTFYDAVAYLPVQERTLVFNAIVEGNVVETLHDRAQALEAVGDRLSAYAADWISADESLHLHNGMRWLWAQAPEEADVDALLSRGQAILADVMRQKDATVKVFDAASEALTAGNFYAPRRNPVAPISRQLGGFTGTQIDRLVASAGGRTVRR